MKSLSVIIPLYNEKDSLRELYTRLCGELKKTGLISEIIFVDDGSRDGSDRILEAIQKDDKRVRIIRFRRNFGKSAALCAGFEKATGDIVLTIDADLQDEPAEMHKLIEKLRDGNDLVSGWKKKRKDPISRKIASRIYNLITAFFTGVPLHDMNCGFKAYRREVIEEITVYGEMHRYIPVLASYKGFRIAEVRVAHNKRRNGSSKFGMGRYFGGFFDLLTVIMLTRYNRKPLHIFGIIGMGMISAGMVIEIYLTIGWFYGMWIEDRPAFMLGILLLIVGVQFMSFGLVAEMLAWATRREQDFSIKEDSGPVDKAEYLN
jgi:glycosyltransferase involved in cell wall biosynthesis